MKAESPATMVVKILDKDYQVASPPDQRAALLDAAQFLDQQMRNIRESGKVFGLERIAVMTALNLSHQLLQLRQTLDQQQQQSLDTGSREQLKQVLGRADAALAKLRQMEIG